jgi:glycerol-3-phosphate dehydrogenase
MPAASSISSANRSSTLDRLERERFDCAVIGGGITGVGIAREATQRGLSVALLEAEDFSSGTSSRSSKLIHGGLRYLAMGDIALVRETALERKQIHRLAPHLAEPRWVVVPTRSRTGLMKIRAGITTYEKLGAVEGADLHRNWSRRELETEEPILDRSRFAHACVYREYLTEDARLVLANLRCAVARGAAVLNHAPVDAICGENGNADGVEAECRLSGRRVRVRARSVINAAGPWVDRVHHLEDPQAPARLHLSKGVHVVLPAERLPVRNIVILGAADRRSIFAIRRGDAIFIGTTDTSYEHGSETWPQITREDVEYLLAPIARDFSVEPIAPEEVVAAWSGLRPLIAEPGKKAHEISRRDEIWIGPKRVVSVAGGKLTGYRPMTRTAVEKAADVCGIQLGAPPAQEEPLPGGDFDGDLEGLSTRLQRDTGLGPDTAARMIRLYGTDAGKVVGLGSDPLVPGAGVLSGEVSWAVEVEGAARLEDVLYRRTRAALYEASVREALVEPIADRMAERLGWGGARREQEIATTREQLARELDFLGESS